jgi:hypothetical protein
MISYEYDNILEMIQVVLILTLYHHHFLLLLYLISLIVLAYAVYLSWVLTDKRSIALAAVLIVPFTGVTQFPNRDGYAGSIAALISCVPIRLAAGFLAISVVMFAIISFQDRSAHANKLTFFTSGCIVSLVVWQSQDFGLAAFFTCLVMLCISFPLFVNLSSIGNFSIGFISGFSIYPLYAFLKGSPLKIEYIGFFSRQFQSGFGSEPIRTPGPVLILLPLIVLLVIVHSSYLIQSKQKNGFSKSLFKKSLFGLGFSIWSLGCFLYYLNRSFASGQLQSILLPVAISISALVGIFLTEVQLEGSFLAAVNPKIRFSRSYLKIYAYLFIFAFPLATILATPNPRIELHRIWQDSSIKQWPTLSSIESVSEAKKMENFARYQNIDFAYFGSSGGFVERETGIKNLSILNSPYYDYGISKNSIRAVCSHLNSVHPEMLLLGDDAADLFVSRKGRLCSIYVQTNRTGFEEGHIALRIDKYLEFDN